MAAVITTEALLREPNLLVPKKKPVGRVKLNMSHPLAKFVTYFYVDGCGVMFNDGITPTPYNRTSSWSDALVYGSILVRGRWNTGFSDWTGFGMSQYTNSVNNAVIQMVRVGSGTKLQFRHDSSSGVYDYVDSLSTDTYYDLAMFFNSGTDTVGGEVRKASFYTNTVYKQTVNYSYKTASGSFENEGKSVSLIEGGRQTEYILILNLRLDINGRGTWFRQLTRDPYQLLIPA